MRIRSSYRLNRLKDRIGQSLVDRLGVHPRRLGYRWWRSESVERHVRETAPGDPPPIRVVHPARSFSNPLPRNIPDRTELPDDPGWWGYSFRDVPSRRSGPTYIATVPDARVVSELRTPSDPLSGGEFFPAILSREGTALDMREIRFREQHADLLRHHEGPIRRLERATWVLERVYDNYSHWFSAHMPKLLLLRDEGLLDDVLMPAAPPSFIRESLRMAGIDIERCPRYEPGTVLDVGELTVVGTDRFRPELLQSVRDALWQRPERPPRRRVFISRRAAERRRMLNEDEVWSVLEAHGFERVVMETLTFAEQVRLMGETAVLFAMHGAGLTNMLFCAAGTHVIEVADLSFPNPNFYATAAAMSHPYWLLAGAPVGDAHPLERDMVADVEGIERLLTHEVQI